MAKRQVFFSFHFQNDVMRTQQVRNIGAIEGNSVVSPNDWESIKRNGESAIKRWIDTNMQNRSCVVVLIGSETASRPWVQYEIEKAWNDRKGLLGIHIHNLNCPRNGACGKGKDPFDGFTLNNGKTSLASIVKCHDPGIDAYNNIARNLTSLIEEAIAIRGKY